GGERNWDYRYTWMRDTTFTLQALHYLNLDSEADDFMQFVADVEPNDDGAMQIMYGIDGRRGLTESTPDHLTRHAAPAPAQTGNAHRRPPRPDGTPPRPPHRLRRRASGPDRERSLRPASERRIRRGSRLHPPPH